MHDNRYSRYCCSHKQTTATRWYCYRLCEPSLYRGPAYGIYFGYFFCFVLYSAGQDAFNGVGLKRIGAGFAELSNAQDYELALIFYEFSIKNYGLRMRKNILAVNKFEFWYHLVRNFKNSRDVKTRSNVGRYH